MNPGNPGWFLSPNQNETKATQSFISQPPSYSPVQQILFQNLVCVCVPPGTPVCPQGASQRRAHEELTNSYNALGALETYVQRDTVVQRMW